MRTEPDPRDWVCPQDDGHELRVLRDEDGAWAPDEEPIVICCDSTCGEDAVPRAAIARAEGGGGA